MGGLLIRILAAVGLVLAILWGIGSWLPRSYFVETSVEIAASPRQVFELVNSLPNWREWSTWDPDRVAGLDISYGDITEGAGAVQTWTEPRGAGKLWIENSVPFSEIQCVISFADFPQMRTLISIEASEFGSRVGWTSEGNLPRGAFYGYAGFIFEAQMTHQFELDLERLKKLAEDQAAAER